MAVTAPFCSRMALVATVVPWMKRSTSAGSAPAMREHLRDGSADALEQVLRRARHLREREPARAVEGHDVGEGAADVDADLHRGLLERQARGTTETSPGYCGI